MPTLTYNSKPESERIVAGFARLVLNPGIVRLDSRLYTRESYLIDRNTIRRDTRAFLKEWMKIRWRNPDDLSSALVEAGRYSFSGRLSYDPARGEWEYCTGQYTPTEIRRAAYQVALVAVRLLSK